MSKSLLTKASLDKYMVADTKPTEGKPSLAAHPVIGNLSLGHMTIGSLVKKGRVSDIMAKARTKPVVAPSPFANFWARLRALLGGRR